MSMLNGGRTPAEDARISTFAGLLSIANHRGYKRGWAAVKFRIIYGKWPDGMDPPPDNPSPELAWWIGKQNAAYAKARKESEVMPNAVSDVYPYDRMNGKEVMSSNGVSLRHKAEEPRPSVEAPIFGLMTAEDLEVDL